MKIRASRWILLLLILTLSVTIRAEGTSTEYD